MYFVGLGHSHVVALAKGAYALQAQGALIAGQPFTCRFHYLYNEGYEPPFVDEPAGRVLNAKIASALSENDPQFVVLSIGGNEHNVLSIVQIYQRYDFILGESPDLPLDETLEIIPESVIRETVREWMSEKTGVLKALRRATRLPMIQIEPPPPAPRAQVLAYPKEFFRSVIDQRKLSPDLLRYKMWRVQVALMREACAECGVAYVETLPRMIDSDGMLAREALGKDATHANDLYGEAMIAEALAGVPGLLALQD